MKSAYQRHDRWVALTGTPGTGKSRVARELVGPVAVAEVADLALATGTGVLSDQGVSVDLARLARHLPSASPGPYPALAVGHLAHFLPVDTAVVLRCHPVELYRRLQRANRLTAKERQANFVAESTDFVLAECTSIGLDTWEVDTTNRPPAAIAREVRSILRRRPERRRAPVDWLADPTVTARLLTRGD